VAETEAALAVASRIPFSYLVVHLGMPTGEQIPHGDNNREAARRSIEEIAALAARVDVRVALEVMPNPLSSAEALAGLVEEELEGLDAGVCLDYGHAHLMGDLGEAIEALSGHLWTTHVHDNHGVRDDHLTPYSGAIDWDAAMMETQKIGYDGVLMFEVSDTGDPMNVLRQCVRARERLETTFVTFLQE
jgi:sugar phosphate isomerase/epimerase